MQKLLQKKALLDQVLRSRAWIRPVNAHEDDLHNKWHFFHYHSRQPLWKRQKLAPLGHSAAILKICYDLELESQERPERLMDANPLSGWIRA